jgi:hypothetical protein
MLPLLSALGIGASALSAMGLIDNVLKIGGKPSDEEVASAIEDHAMKLSQTNGVPMDVARKAVAERTLQDLQEKHSFQPGEALFQTLGLLPGIGAARAGMAGISGAKMALKAGEELSGADKLRAAFNGIKGADGGMFLGKAPKGSVQATAKPSAQTQKEASYTLDLEKGGEELAEMKTPTMRAAHSAEEVGEYGAKGSIDTKTIKNIPVETPTYASYTLDLDNGAKDKQMAAMFKLRKRLPANAMQEMPAGVGEYGQSLSGDDQFMQELARRIGQ